MNENTTITMKDIARELGVSVATVSRALKDSPRISEVQRQRIKTSKDLVLVSTGRYMEIWDHDTYSRANEATTDYAAKVDERLGRTTSVDSE